MPVWLYEKNSEEISQISNFVQENLDVFATEYSKEINLTGVKAALDEYSQRATNNKILIRTKAS